MAKIFDGIIGAQVTANQILQAGNDGETEIIINSMGGSLFAGFEIMDAIKLQGKIKSIGIIGSCASAATFALLAVADRWATENARFLIHNPTIGIEGDALEMQNAANELLKEQKIIVEKYTTILNKTADEIQSLMDKSNFLTAHEALQLGLITRIKTNETMNVEVEKKLNIFQSLLNDVSNKIQNFVNGVIKNETKQDVNGIEIDFGANTATIGNAATINGVPATGEFVMEDGSTWKFEGGILTEIAEDEPVTVDQLKTENAVLQNSVKDLEAKILNLAAEKETIQNNFKASVAEIEIVKNKFTEFKNAFSGAENFQTSAPETEQKPQARVLWTNPNKKNK